MGEKGYLKRCRFAGFILVLLLSTVATATETPLEIYGRLPALEDLAVSPDGKYLAFTQTTTEEREVFIVSLSDMKVFDSLKLGKVKLRNTIWADNDHLLFETSITDKAYMGARKGEYFMLRVYDITTKKSYNPIHATSSFPIMNIIIGNPMIRSKDHQTFVYVAGIYFSDNISSPALFEINLANKGVKMIEIGPRTTDGWLVDDKGDIVASQAYDEFNQNWGISIKKDGKLVEALSGKAEIEHPTISGFATTGNALCIKILDQNEWNWKLLSRETCALGEAVSEVKNLAGVSTDPYTDRVIGGRTMKGNPDFIFFDQRHESVWKEIQSYFPGEHVDYISASKDFQKIAILVEGAKHGYGIMWWIFQTSILSR